jgi:energy-converting hydrogenase Eha subunit C
MRDKFIWIGVLIVALGIVLPWASYSATLGDTRVGGGTIPGYEYLQSFIALVVSVAGALLGIKPSKQIKRLILVASGAIVVIVAGSALVDLSGPAQVIQPPSAELQLSKNAPNEFREAQELFDQNMTARISSAPHIGVFVTMLGGLFIGVGGYTSTMRKTE